jgi:YidC/Oxa1 family membrane protein insertase
VAEQGTLRRAAAAVVLACALATARGAAAEAEGADVRTACIEARFALEGARPETLTTRLPGSSRAAHVLEIARPLAPAPFRVIGDGDGDLTARLVQLRYGVERREDPETITLIFRAVLQPGVDVVQRYTFARQICSIDVSLALEGPQAPERPLALELAAGSGFAPRPARGLGGLSERLGTVDVDRAGALELEPGEAELELSPGHWGGLRSRFWALLASGVERPVRATIEGERLVLRSSGAGPLQVRLYVGPIERATLAAVDPSLAGLLFSARSLPIRALCVLLSAILAGLLALVGHAGLAVVLLSPTVKLLLLPLSRIAERWQREVDETRTRLAPGLAEIRASYRGEERSRRALELHRDLDVSMFYGLKSLLGVAIQLPVFIAAFHVLDESIALLGAPLLWIEDLSLPDRLATLPFAAPFFGSDLNLLPFVMTAVTILSTQLHRGGPRDPALRRRQRRGLHAMAAGFFLLFYTFPAGMVLYWTTNNLSALLFQALGERRLVARGPLRAAQEWRT